MQFGATRVHNDVRFHWGSIAASRDVMFLEPATMPVVTHRKGYTPTITDIASSTRLEVFAALAETRESLAPPQPRVLDGPPHDRETLG